MTQDAVTPGARSRQIMANTGRLLKLYPLLFIGFAMLLAVTLVGIIGSPFMDVDLSRPGTTPIDVAPSREYLLGTDSMGRDVLAVMLRGTPLTLQVGFMAATIGMGIGIVLGFVGGFYGGVIDSVFKGLADILITIPALLILVVVAVSLTGPVSITLQALVIASVSWMWPTRTIRAQVLTMRERAYVDVAELSGAGRLEIIFLEILPNLLPYLAASFAATVGIAILTTVGMDALGLGPQNVPTLGNTVYWALFYSAPLRGLWWWWVPPIITLGIVFIGLYLVTAGLDQIANPRLRRSG